MRITVDICGHPFHALLDDDVVTFAAFGDAPDSPAAPDSHPVAVALHAYAAGDIHAIDDIPVRQPGTEFRQRVWGALRTITPGQPISYQELAQRAGRPNAVRAAASGCANNAVALIVPCHRVVRADGALGGYLFGVELKRLLLAHEAASTG